MEDLRNRLYEYIFSTIEKDSFFEALIKEMIRYVHYTEFNNAPINTLDSQEMFFQIALKRFVSQSRWFLSAALPNSTVSYLGFPAKDYSNNRDSLLSQLSRLNVLY